MSGRYPSGEPLTVLRAIRQHCRCSRNARYLLHELLGYVDNDGRTYVSLVALTEPMGIAKGTISDAAQELIEAGWLAETRGRFDPATGRQIPTLRQLLIPASVAAETGVNPLLDRGQTTTPAPGSNGDHRGQSVAATGVNPLLDRGQSVTRPGSNEGTDLPQRSASEICLRDLPQSEREQQQPPEHGHGKIHPLPSREQISPQAPDPNLGATTSITPTHQPPAPAAGAQRRARKAPPAAQAQLVDLGEPLPAPDPLAAPDVTAVLEHWRSRLYHSRTPSDLPERRKRIADRLAEGLGVDTLKAAIDGASLDPWLMGTDPKSTKKYLGLETILRDAPQSERLAQLFDDGVAEGKIHPDGGDPGVDAQGRLRSLAAADAVPRPPKAPPAADAIDAKRVGPTGLTLEEIRRRKAAMEQEKIDVVARARANCTPEELALLDAAQKRGEARVRKAMGEGWH